VSASRDLGEGKAFAELVEIMSRLRGPGGCPWDREQDHRSLRGCALEEAYEVLEAIDAGNREALRQELGDLLLQVIFHAQLAAEAGDFDIGDVIQGLRDKLVSRHPHVFGDPSRPEQGRKVVETAEGVLAQWDSIKQEELDHTAADQAEAVPKALPALMRAQKVQRRAAGAGWQRSPGEARAAAEEALTSLHDGARPADAERVIGEALFAVAEVARSYGVDAEQALRERVDRFVADTKGREGGS